MTNNPRYRLFNVLLYPDNEKHQKAISRLKNGEFLAVGICHDMDKYTEDTNEYKAGELKKEHYHFVVKFKNAKTVSALSKELDIEERFIDPTKSFKNSAAYLLHLGVEDKYQYDTDDLVGSLSPEILKMLDDTSEEIKALRIVDLIRSFDSEVSYDCFLEMLCKNNLFDVFRRSAYSFNRVFDEHNNQIRTGISYFNEM